MTVQKQSFPLMRPFVISRGAIDIQDVVVVELRQGAICGRGEASPSARFGETADGVLASIHAARRPIEAAVSRDEIATILPKGAARSVVDSAFWDLEAKRSGRTVWETIGIAEPRPRESAFTLSLGDPAAMADAAHAAAGFHVLKLKLGAPGDLERVRAVRAAAPGKRLIVDANEAWSFDVLKAIVAPFAALGVELIEQPLPVGADDALLDFRSPVPLCADESCTDRASLARIAGRYAFINVKLEKCGGLSEALALISDAKQRGFRIMVGCRVGSSLGLAPVVVAAQLAEFADLDGPFLLKSDRPNGLSLQDGCVSLPQSSLWG
ncbi:MAG: N-acetyl-D-Glu racemase DgcA [Rhizomicrobium sp.]